METLKIYKITNLENGMLYVGQTKRPLKERFQEHSKAKKSLIGRAIQKYGRENFTIEVIEECETFEQLDEREIFWIAKLNTKAPNGYNLAIGGSGGHIVSEEARAKISAASKGNKNCLGRKLSEETKAKISASNKGKHISDEHKKKLSEAFSGRFVSAETRAKISLAQKGRKRRKLTEEEKAKISATHKGRKVSEETRMKISKAQMGHKISAETRAKISAAQKGRPRPARSEETKAKISESQKLRWARKRMQLSEVN